MGKSTDAANVVLSGLSQANQNGAMVSDGENTFFKRATLNSADRLTIPRFWFGRLPPQTSMVLVPCKLLMLSIK